MTALEEATQEYEAQQAEVKQTALVARDTSQFSSILDGPKFSQIQRAAKLFATSKLVPAHFQGDMPSVFVALQMAIRLEVDPFMLMQNVYMVHGRPGMEGKLVIALINKRGPFKGPVQWRFEGQGMDRKCTAYAKLPDGEVCEAEVTMEQAKKEGWLDKPGSKWKTLPDLMLRYRSAVFLARFFCPEVTMGIQTVEEMEDISENTTHTVRVIDSRPVIKPVNDDVPAHLGTKENLEQAVKDKNNPIYNDVTNYEGKFTQEYPQETKPKKKRGRKPNKAKRAEALEVLRGCLVALNYDAKTDDDLLMAINYCGQFDKEFGSLDEVGLDEIQKAIEAMDKRGESNEDS